MAKIDALKKRLAAAGLRPSIARGQNFLVDANIVRAIAAAGTPGPEDIVLEVGPGTGFLTTELAQSGARVLAVELDHGLLPLAREAVAAWPNVEFLEGDILAGKNEIHPLALAGLERMLAAAPGAHLKSISNLPYSAGTPLVINLLSSPLPWETGVFLLQKEVAQRISAAPGTDSYGAVSIYAALAARTQLDRIVPPQSFWPRPKVDSAVIVMHFLPAAQRMALPWAALRAVCGAVFGARRKTLRNALRGCFPDLDISALLSPLGIAPDCRGETLGPEQFLALAQSLD